MKKIYFILIFFLTLLSARGQSFTFEGATVPAGWVPVNGVLSLSADHFKDGSKSLCWETSGVSVMNVSFASFIASTGNSAFMQIYSPEVSCDTIRVEFLYYSAVKRTANFLCNFSGWREFNRSYMEYASTLSSSISSVRITLYPTSTGTRKIYFDNVNFNYPTDTKRIVGNQWLLDKAYFTTNNTLLELYANPVDLGLNAPTQAELNDLDALRLKLKRIPATGNASALLAAKNYVQSLNIVRNADGSVKGNVIATSASDLTTSFMTDILTKAENLAAAGLTDANTLTIFRNLVDHLLDQGIAEGCNFQISTTDYTNARIIPAKLLNLLPACTPAQQTGILKLARWISYYGNLYNPQSTYLTNLNSDIVYLFLPHIMGVALFQTDEAVAVRELKAFKRFLERNTEYVPGGDDILKSDGTGFHHGTHYNNYMYSYKTWAEYLYYLKGTQFRISTDAYQRFKKAIISVYCMGTQDAGDMRFFANSLCGRNPYGTGMQLQFSKDLFDKLIQVGADCLGTSVDEELAAAYNYFFKTNKYSVPQKSYEGFYQFNYSPIGVYRKGNWVVTMRAPTTKFFGAEIYSGANRFGRYQSHGSLEVMYSGNMAASGCPTNGTGGGWDWNVVPGATTVHYTSWQEMMPNKNLTDRFDQYTKTKNFAGALSWGDCGMFACDFDQIDAWGSQRFTPTNLAFRKSMFAFGNMVVSLGSGISSSGSYSSDMITATNLFQNIISASSGGLLLNGSVVTNPASSTIASTQDNWLITPQGTGYYIPAGNDPIEIRYAAQSTPDETGADYASPSTTSTAAKAYLNHGVKPVAKSYQFAVVPATTSVDMQALASQIARGDVYQIQAQNSSVHALTYIPLGITAYSFFGAASNLNFGIVKASSAENLLMERNDTQTNRHYFAICNPNLKPQTDATYGWLASASQTTLTLAGAWKMIEPVNGVVMGEPANGQTQVMVTLNNGDPLYFGIKSYADTSVGLMTEDEWVKLFKTSNGINLCFSEVIAGEINVKVYSPEGRIVYQKCLNNGIQNVEIPTGKLPKGVFYCSVSGLKRIKTIKWIN